MAAGKSRIGIVNVPVGDGPKARSCCRAGRSQCLTSEAVRQERILSYLGGGQPFLLKPSTDGMRLTYITEGNLCFTQFTDQVLISSRKHSETPRVTCEGMSGHPVPTMHADSRYGGDPCLQRCGEDTGRDQWLRSTWTQGEMGQWTKSFHLCLAFELQSHMKEGLRTMAWPKSYEKLYNSWVRVAGRN